MVKMHEDLWGRCWYKEVRGKQASSSYLEGEYPPQLGNLPPENRVPAYITDDELSTHAQSAMIVNLGKTKRYLPMARREVRRDECIYGNGPASISVAKRQMSDYLQTQRTLVASDYSTADTI